MLEKELGPVVKTLPQAEGGTDTKLREGPQCLERLPLAGEKSGLPAALASELSYQLSSSHMTFQ